MLLRAEQLCVSAFCNRCSGPTGANDNHYCLVASVVVGSPQGGVGDAVGPENTCCSVGGIILCTAASGELSHHTASP